MRLQLSPEISSGTRKLILQTLEELPCLNGSDISLAIKPRLTAYRGELRSGLLQAGTPVHAAAFIRRREMILEKALVRNPGMFRLILVHELFHFVWARLGNLSRASFADLVSAELRMGATGELGESADVKKTALRLKDQGLAGRLGRDYVCESFCDTAAWLYSRTELPSEFRLAKRWRELRRLWFTATFNQPRNC